MTSPTAASPSVEERLTNLDSRMGHLESRMNGIESRMNGIESRMAALEAVMTLFIDEQREHRREVNARFERLETHCLETRMDRVGAGITRMNYTVLGIVGALAIAVIVAGVFS